MFCYTNCIFSFYFWVHGYLLTFHFLLHCYFGHDTNPHPHSPRPTPITPPHAHSCWVFILMTINILKLNLIDLVASSVLNVCFFILKRKEKKWSWMKWKSFALLFIWIKLFCGLHFGLLELHWFVGIFSWVIFGFEFVSWDDTDSVCRECKLPALNVLVGTLSLGLSYLLLCHAGAYICVSWVWISLLVCV